MHTFAVDTCGEYEIAHLDGNEVSDIYSYEVSRTPEGTKLLTLKLVLDDIKIVSAEQK